MKTAMDRLNKIKGKIKWNTYKTIVGQIRSGNVEGAMVGIERLENKIKGDKYCELDR